MKKRFRHSKRMGSVVTAVRAVSVAGAVPGHAPERSGARPDPPEDAIPRAASTHGDGDPEAKYLLALHDWERARDAEEDAHDAWSTAQRTNDPAAADLRSAHRQAEAALARATASLAKVQARVERLERIQTLQSLSSLASSMGAVFDDPS